MVRLQWLRPAAALLPALLGASLQAAPSLCDSGRRQSPIDIVATQRQALPPLEFHYRGTPLRTVNDGHTVRVRFGADSQLGIGGRRHRLQQFHFHLPGGDRIQGEEFPMAMHLLHKDDSGRLVSLVVLFRLGAEHAPLGRLLPWLPSAGVPEQTLAARVDASDFLPPQPGYYRYEGSLTSPPCTEGVLWIVMRQPLELSAAQLARLRQLVPGPGRPVQPLNGRRVLESP
jgi:carbonic anhydrase